MSVLDHIVNLDLLPKQMEFVQQAEARYKTFSGCRGGGKSYAICVDTVIKAAHPGVRGGLYRMNYSDLEDTTLLTLLEGDDLPPVLPPGTYKHNQNKHRIDIHGGGTILYGGFDKGIQSKEMGGTGSKSSMNLTFANVDEAVQVPESLIVQLDGSVRMKHPVIGNQLGFACNPGPPNHWLARRFGLSLGHVLNPNHWAVKTNIYENFMLPEGFADALAATLSGVALMRYIWGEWVGSDGVIYVDFSRDFHVMFRSYDPTRTVYGVDPGTNDPYSIVQLDVLPDNGVHIPREYYKTGTSPADQVSILKDMVGDSGDLCVVDQAYKGLIKDMRRAGINAVPCVKKAGGTDESIMRGVGVVAQRLKGIVNGTPMLTIDPCCVNTIAEFESYEYDKNASGFKDKPKDANNHSMDAIRYGIEKIDGVGGSYVSEPIVMSGDMDKKQLTEEDFEPLAEDEIIDFDEVRNNDPRWGIPSGNSGGGWI